MFRRLKTYQLVTDVSLAGAFFLLALPLELVMMGTIPVGGLWPALGAALVAVLFSGALAIRRLSPSLALAVSWAGALLQMGLGRPPSFSDMAIFGVLYTTAAYGAKRTYWAGFASTLVGALAITAYLLFSSLFVGTGLSWQSLPLALLILVAAAFALGLSWTIGALVRTAVQARENREAQERAQAQAYAEQERVRIARDMHDVVAHSLAVVVAQADGARYAAASDPSVATAALSTISSTARSALADVRLLLAQLRHSQLDGPQPTLADLEQLYAQVRAAGVDLRVEVHPVPPGVPPAAVQLAVYRILQEALTNALRHGDGGPVHVRLAWLPDRVDLEVRNRVRAAVAEPTSGHGLIGMRERAQLVGGRMDVGAQGDAFVVRATIPVGGPR